MIFGVFLILSLTICVYLKERVVDIVLALATTRPTPEYVMKNLGTPFWSTITLTWSLLSSHV
jgi:hypothetical protein